MSVDEDLETIRKISFRMTFITQDAEDVAQEASVIYLTAKSPPQPRLAVIDALRKIYRYRRSTSLPVFSSIDAPIWRDEGELRPLEIASCYASEADLQERWWAELGEDEHEREWTTLSLHERQSRIIESHRALGTSG